ncbi:MAG TPA: peptidoglycan DD-metalloendopeptidase family protein [Anaerolineales bacterium]|nr:peptidoglycan DD-metalloendopeptidase family protein [Anaerolineales bacterium]
MCPLPGFFVIGGKRPGMALFAILFLGACSQVVVAAHPPDETPTAIAPAEESRPVPVNQPAEPVPGETEPPTPTLEPIRFTFPDAGEPPQSIWRPPLYPVPWAPTAYDHFYFIRPIGANEVNWPDGSYRYGGIFFEDVVHSGVDIGAPVGTPVLAAGPGKVIWAGYGLYTGVDGSNDPYGIAVAIRHDYGFDGQSLFSLYAHLDHVDVTRGQLVEGGQVIGAVGTTGFTTGPHLHFEVRLGNNDFFTTYNPELWIAPPEGWGVLVGRVMGTAGQVLNFQALTVTNLDTSRVWESVTYADQVSVNADPHYRENFVISDLPAGRYSVSTWYLGRFQAIEFEIFPGRVTYFHFRGMDSFRFGSPDELRPTPTPEG